MAFQLPSSFSRIGRSFDLFLFPCRGLHRRLRRPWRLEAPPLQQVCRRSDDFVWFSFPCRGLRRHFCRLWQFSFPCRGLLRHSCRTWQLETPPSPRGRRPTRDFDRLFGIDGVLELPNSIPNRLGDAIKRPRTLQNDTGSSSECPESGSRTTPERSRSPEERPAGSKMPPGCVQSRPDSEENGVVLQKRHFSGNRRFTGGNCFPRFG